MVGRLADKHPRAVGFVGSFETRRQIHGIADDRIVAGLLRANAAHHNITGGDADAYVDLRETPFEADEVGQLGTKRCKAGKLIERSKAGETGLFVGASEGRTPKSHYGITDILVDDAAMASDRLRHHRHIALEYSDQCGRCHAFAESGETLHIAEKDRHLAARAFGMGQLGAVDQPGDNPGIDIFTERLANLCFDPQFANHAVEGLRQPANLVPRGNRTTVSSAPPSTAAVPASSRRTGRTRPRVTAAATMMPSNAAIARSAKPIWTTCR